MLFLNATDMDRSREYGQESIIYSLEGSSHFRINARSGEPPDVLSLFSFQFPLLNFPVSSPSFFFFHPLSFPPLPQAGCLGETQFKDSPDFSHQHLLSHCESFGRSISGSSPPGGRDT